MFEHDGQLLFSYHYYAGKNRGRPQLGINRMHWTAEGWPDVEDEMLYVGTIDQDE